MNRVPIFFYALLFIFSIVACASGNEKENNAEIFFQGLDALNQEGYDNAIKLFSQTSEKEGVASASFATEKLIPLLYEDEEFEQVIEKAKQKLLSETENITYYKADENFLYRYMLLSMIQQKKSDIELNISEWLDNNAFSREHYLFFTDEIFLAYANESSLSEKILETISIKEAVYTRDYGKAVRTIADSKDFDAENPSKYFEKQKSLYLSNVGRALLYGANDKLFYARTLELAADTYPKKSTEAFMCNFYAGRLYDTTGRAYTSDALFAFENAMKAAVKELDYDTALWYYLSATRETSSRSAITALQDFSSTWNDPYYFDDFLEDLAFQLLDNENYKGFFGLYEIIENHISPVSLSKYAYISALLINENYVTVEGKSKENAVTEALKTAYNAQDGSLYYRMMASVMLEIPSNSVLNDLLKREQKNEKVFDAEFEYILIELAQRGFAQEAYDLYAKNATLVSVDTAILLSRQLALENNPTIENNFDNNFYPESLRIASQAFSQSEKNIPKEDMMLLYPRYYTEYVTQVSEVYDLEELIIYAIMRSESFFDHDVMSWAGAVGLTQLMPTTAGDVARKLKVRDYDLHNARQNIDFGMFYFDELIPREGVDNSILRALFAYNAGITNVRRWNREFPELLDTPELFLEKIPFAETREYGRKVLSAAVMYGLLYYDMEVEEVVNAIMN